MNTLSCAYKGALFSIWIHENGHILSLNSEQGNNDTNSELGVKGKQILLKKQSECAPNYYNDMAGCLYDDSYLNKFFQS